jgi:hypothetical protein
MPIASTSGAAPSNSVVAALPTTPAGRSPRTGVGVVRFAFPIGLAMGIVAGLLAFAIGRVRRDLVPA